MRGLWGVMTLRRHGSQPVQRLSLLSAPASWQLAGGTVEIPSLLPFSRPSIHRPTLLSSFNGRIFCFECCSSPGPCLNSVSYLSAGKTIGKRLSQCTVGCHGSDETAARLVAGTCCKLAWQAEGECVFCDTTNAEWVRFGRDVSGFCICPAGLPIDRGIEILDEALRTIKKLVGYIYSRSTLFMYCLTFIYWSCLLVSYYNGVCSHLVDA